MQSKSAKAVLRASAESDIMARVDHLMVAFWDNANDIEEIIYCIEKTKNELAKRKIVPLISIMHCEKLLNSVRSFSWTNQDMPYEWFIMAILHATDWVIESKREEFISKYLIAEPQPQLKSPDAFTVSEHAKQENEDFGFEIVVKKVDKQEPFFLLPLLYLAAAIGGMIDYHRGRK